MSHGVRRDSTAIALLSKPRMWLVARGDSVRHLRPDIDSAEGWIRAVALGKRHLGGETLVEISLDEITRSCYKLCFRSHTRALHVPVGSLPSCIALLYSQETLENSSCDGKAPTGPVPLPLMPAIGNILVDRIAAGYRLV
ncbi:MAG: hypothetical protein F7C07_01355 [Desulfurococcales archaeon]|nr:hypothetical protein [Desulfurococcales archaeon]